MTDISKAVTTTTEADWRELGLLFADQSSADQAEFLVAFYEAVDDMQIAYIASEKIFDRAGRGEVGIVFGNLVGQIDPEYHRYED